MLVVRCIRAELVGLTAIKTGKLHELYASWRNMVKLQSTYRELRERHPYLDSRYAREATFKAKSPHEPLILPKDLFRVVWTGKRFARFFLRIPTESRKYLWLPMRMRPEDEEYIQHATLADSKITKHGRRFFLHLTVKRKMLATKVSSLLAVDLGERILATAVLWRDSQASPTRWFYGRQARGIRRHYAWLRKRLGERRLLKEIRRIGSKEQRTVRDLCHKISRQIVNTAEQNDAAIVLGDLKGISRRTRGRRMNRIVANMPHNMLTRMVLYKAAWAGIPVITASEAYTSRTCPRCGSGGQRPHQGLFRCPACAYNANADYVGARNLAERTARWFTVGALRVQAQEGGMTYDENSQVPYQTKR
jgi:putative transposase